MAENQPPIIPGSSRSINVAEEGTLTMRVMPSIIKVYCLTEERLEIPRGSPKSGQWWSPENRPMRT